jgi:hypothetical protein
MSRQSSYYTVIPTDYNITVPCNKADIMLQDRKITCLQIDISTRNDGNLMTKGAEKYLKTNMH